MPVPTNTLQTVTQTDVREDLEDAVFDLDPYKTPFMNLIRRGKATSTLHEWDTDSLAAQNPDNAQIQGDDATADAITATARLGNYTQISRKVVQIARTSQSVRTAGRTGGMGYQLLKKSKELKRDMESILTANQARTAPGATTAGVTAGLAAFITVNDVFQTGGTPSGASPTGVTAAGAESFGNGTTARTDNSVLAALTEQMVDTLAQDIYKASAQSPPYLIVSPANKQAISKFTGPAGTRFNRVEDKRLRTAIDEYETDFGVIRVMPDILLNRSKDCYAVDPEYVKLCFLDPFRTEVLAKTGDSDRKMIICEYALEVCNERALGGIFDTTG